MIPEEFETTYRVVLPLPLNLIQETHKLKLNTKMGEILKCKLKKMERIQF